MTNNMKTGTLSRNILLGLALLTLLSSGCASVAASVAGGTVIAAGLYAVQDTAEETVSASITDTQQVVHTVLQRLNVNTIDIQKSFTGKSISRYDFDCELVGDHIVPVGISLEMMSDQITKITISARRDIAHPELETADSLLREIVGEINRKNYAARRQPAI